MKKKGLLFIVLFFVAFGAFAQIPIKHLVIFGDNYTDDGFDDDGGFDRYSNGFVWPEYIALKLCNDCSDNEAWGGARTDLKNYHHLDWSGVLWQVQKFKMTTKPEETLFIIWAGANDLIDGTGNPQVSAQNLLIAVQTLIGKGAQNIEVMNLPNFTLAPAYNNPQVAEYAQFGPLKAKVKTMIDTHNKNLAGSIVEKQKKLAKENPNVKLEMVDFTNFLEPIIKNHLYDNTTDVWSGTYKYPLLTGYMWWDGFNLMTSMHKRVADHVMAELQHDGFVLVGE